MTYWTESAPASPASRTLAAIAKSRAATFAKIVAGSATLTVAVALAVGSEAYAQQPAPTAPAPIAPAPTHKPKPKKPAKMAPEAQQTAPVEQPPAQPPQGQQTQNGQQPVQLIFSPWTKFCLKGQPGQPPDPNAKQVCFTGKDARVESGQPVAAAGLIEPEGTEKKILRVTLPLGMQLVHGTRVIVDQNQPMTAPYVICFTNGCMADYDANADLIAKLKKGQGLVLQAINATGQPLSVVMPLSDFVKAYEGPPTDPKVFEEQQRKLQEELQRRADEARKKLESQQGAPTSQATPPSAPPPPPAGKTQ
jgi:invasion protein IalB